MDLFLKPFLPAETAFFDGHLKKFQISLAAGGASGAKHQAVRP
jgi:hypothetical protein